MNLRSFLPLLFLASSASAPTSPGGRREVHRFSATLVTEYRLDHHLPISTSMLPEITSPRFHMNGTMPMSNGPPHHIALSGSPRIRRSRHGTHPITVTPSRAIIRESQDGSFTANLAGITTGETAQRKRGYLFEMVNDTRHVCQSLGLHLRQKMCWRRKEGSFALRVAYIRTEGQGQRDMQTRRARRAAPSGLAATVWLTGKATVINMMDHLQSPATPPTVRPIHHGLLAASLRRKDC
jgi:hypothetical protein